MLGLVFYYTYFLIFGMHLCYILCGFIDAIAVIQHCVLCVLCSVLCSDFITFDECKVYCVGSLIIKVTI